MLDVVRPRQKILNKRIIFVIYVLWQFCKKKFKIIIYSDVVGFCSLNKTVDYSTGLCVISGEHIYPILSTDSKWSYGSFSRVVIHTTEQSIINTSNLLDKTFKDVNIHDNIYATGYYMLEDEAGISLGNNTQKMPELRNFNDDSYDEMMNKVKTYSDKSV